MRPLACGLCAAIHSIPNSWRLVRSASALFLPQLFRSVAGPAPEDAVFISNGPKGSVASQPSPSVRKSLPGVVFGETGPDPTGSVIDQRDQLTSWPGPPANGTGAILHHQLPKLPGAGATRGSFSPAGCAAARRAWSSTSAASPAQVTFWPSARRRAWSEIRIACRIRAKPSLEGNRELAVRGPSA